MDQRQISNDNLYDISSKSRVAFNPSNASYQQPLQYHHYQPNDNSSMAISSIGLPIHCATQAQNVSSASAAASAPSNQIGCPQHQPIYNQIYQSLQTYHSPFSQPATLFSPPSISNTMPRLQQHVFAHTLRHHQPTTDCASRQPSYALATLASFHQDQLQKSLVGQHKQQQLVDQQQQQQQQLRAPISISSSQLMLLNANNSPATSNLSAALVGINQTCDSQLKTTTTPTNQRNKLDDCSSSSGAANNNCLMQDANSRGKFKSYLTHLVLASNIPLAYAIILVAFLITIIAATSIITVLTIVLTITGYTAYPITENTFNTSLAIGIVCASFALVLVTASLIVWRRHCQAAYYYLDDPQSASRATNSPQLSETYDDSEYGSVPVAEWAKHVQKLHVDSDIGFSREFEQIQQASSANLSSVHSHAPENKHKNRYINIVAYDHTRVTLRPLPGQKKPGFDYINANFIDVSAHREDS